MLSASAVSDALDMLGESGQVHPLRTLVPGHSCIGPAYTVRFEPAQKSSDAPAADYIEAVPAGAVVVIDNGGRTDCTVWGGLLSAFAVQRGIAGTVIWGACRDIAETRGLAYPLFGLRSYMRTGKGRVRLAEVGAPVRLGSVEVAAQDIVVADDDGVICVARERWSIVEQQARAIEAAEERIQADVGRGKDLAEARRLHRYNQFRFESRDDD